MKYFIFFISSVFFLFSSVYAEEEFGYVTYSVTNVGDYIQSIAAKRFLPEDSIGIDREFIGVFDHPNIVKAIVNGWFMHTKDLNWYRKDIAAPEKSWPPSSSIQPLLISLHFWDDFVPNVLTNESIEYLRKHAPIGARDLATLMILQQQGVPSYFSGCLTLTLDNPYAESDREDVIYAVDIDQECLRYIRRRAKCKVVVLSHIYDNLPFLSEKEKLAYAEKLLELYRKAKCVITTRFHAAMPCLAFQTPVLLLDPSGSRFGGITDLLHTCSKQDLLRGRSQFDFNRPPKNKSNYLPLRENLIKIVTNWVSDSSYNYSN